MRIVFMGTPEFSVSVLEALVAAGHELAAVYCQPPRRAGRGKQERPSPVQVRAEELGLPVRHPANFKADQDRADFAALNADIAVVVAYGLILPRAILDAPRLGCLNIHASLLPRWRGAAPIQRAIMTGDAATGVCIMQMEAGLDTGPVLRCVETPITADDTGATLHDRLSDIGAKLIVEVLADLPIEARPQPETGVTYAEKIDKAEAKISFARPAAQVDQHIRGLSPFPGAWFEIDGERIKVLQSVQVDGHGTPGTVLEETTIACETGAVRLTRLQRAGKAPMDAEVFLRGFPLESGRLLT